MKMKQEEKSHETSRYLADSGRRFFHLVGHPHGSRNAWIGEISLEAEKQFSLQAR
jgi:hypothetical protein